MLKEVNGIIIKKPPSNKRETPLIIIKNSNFMYTINTNNYMMHPIFQTKFTLQDFTFYCMVVSTDENYITLNCLINSDMVR